MTHQTIGRSCFGNPHCGRCAKAAVGIIALLLGWFTLLPPRASAQVGMPLWTNRYNGPSNGADYPSGIAVDVNGNVFVAGYSIASNGYYTYATVAYSSAG